MSMQIAVLGAGAFGTSIAKSLERKHQVTLWARTGEGAEEIARTRESPHLRGHKLGDSVIVTHDLASAVRGKAMIVSVTPSHAIRGVLGEAAEWLDEQVILVNASKGLEEGTLATIDRIYDEVLPAPIAKRAAFLSGPTFAKELAAGLPAALVVASDSARSAATVQEELSTERLRLYTSDDVIGIELGGALKNVCAIGAGIADGLGYGHNTRAALITRGLSEITRLGARMGAHPLTFMGLAGLGDLVLTCTGDLSRNRTVGLELGRGKTLEQILSGMNSVAEGVKTARAGKDLADKLAVEMPITDAICAVLYEGKSPKDAVVELMTRDLKSERG
jgi:glycerol-3-phosphate dehydrogenase (NAD(P)+)